MGRDAYKVVKSATKNLLREYPREKVEFIKLDNTFNFSYLDNSWSNKMICEIPHFAG